MPGALPFIPGLSARGGGGGGLHFRDPADEFTGADIAAARTARDTFFALAANASALRQFQGDQALAIILSVTGQTARTFETYLPGQVGMAYDNTQWVERTDAVQGDKGDKGDTGQGIPPGGLPFSDLVGQIADTQIPASIMRDAEFSAAAVRALLGLTAAEVNDLVTGGTISGNVITLPQNDGTSITLTIPGGGMADGVVTGGSINSAGTELTLQRSQGADVTVNIPAALRGSGTADGRLRFSQGAPDNADGIDGDADLDTNAGTFYEKVSGAWVERFTVSATPPVQDHTRRAAVSPDANLTSLEILAGTMSMTNTITIPSWMSGTRYVYLGVPEDTDDITDIRSGGISTFGAWQRDPAGVFEGHKWWRTTDPQGQFGGSGATYEIVQ